MATKLWPNRQTTSHYLRFQSNLGFMKLYERTSSETYVLLKRGSEYNSRHTFHESLFRNRETQSKHWKAFHVADCFHMECVCACHTFKTQTFFLQHVPSKITILIRSVHVSDVRSQQNSRPETGTVFKGCYLTLDMPNFFVCKSKSTFHLVHSHFRKKV